VLFNLTLILVLTPLLFWILTFIYTARVGSPYVPIKTGRYHNILQFIKPGMHIADLGAGDGRILIEAVHRGAARATGWESDFGVYLLGLWRIRKSGVDRAKIAYHFGDFWRADVSKTDLIYVYQMTKYMKPMKDKIISQLKRGTLIISPDYKIPGMKVHKTIKDPHRGIYIYQTK